MNSRNCVKELGRKKLNMDHLMVHPQIFFILEDIPDLEKVLNLLSDLSATSYLVKGSKGAYLCFAKTRRAYTFTSKMRKVMQDESLGFVQCSQWWTPILDDYRKGKIEERFFYMFPPRTK